MRRSRLGFRLGVLAALAPLALLVSVVDAPGASASPLPGNCSASGAVVRCTFSYNGTNGADGAAQRFVVPHGVRAVTLEARGASGGAGGGLGGDARGTFRVAPGTVLWVLVGGQGGFNGGGSGVAAGGGASDVRVGTTGLDARVVVGGGGGASGVARFLAPGLDVTLPLIGGAGGGPSGSGATCDFTPPTGSTVHIEGCGGGGTPTGGGAGGSSGASTCFVPPVVVPAQNGTTGSGGNGGTVSCAQPIVQSVTGAGGGGGFFGGGGGGGTVGIFPLTAIRGGGGGGSGYVRPDATGVVNDSGVQNGNGMVVISYAHTPSQLTDCLRGGWRTLVDDHGHPFRNVVDCLLWAFFQLR